MHLLLLVACLNPSLLGNSDYPPVAAMRASFQNQDFVRVDIEPMGGHYGQFPEGWEPYHYQLWKKPGVLAWLDMNIRWMYKNGVHSRTNSVGSAKSLYPYQELFAPIVLQELSNGFANTSFTLVPGKTQEYDVVLPFTPPLPLPVRAVIQADGRVTHVSYGDSSYALNTLIGYEPGTKQFMDNWKGYNYFSFERRGNLFGDASNHMHSQLSHEERQLTALLQTASSTTEMLIDWPNGCTVGQEETREIAVSWQMPNNAIQQAKVVEAAQQCPIAIGGNMESRRKNSNGKAQSCLEGIIGIQSGGVVLDTASFKKGCTSKSGSIDYPYSAHFDAGTQGLGNTSVHFTGKIRLKCLETTTEPMSLRAGVSD